MCRSQHEAEATWVMEMTGVQWEGSQAEDEGSKGIVVQRRGMTKGEKTEFEVVTILRLPATSSQSEGLHPTFACPTRAFHR